MRVTLDLFGFTKEVDIDMYSYNRGFVEARIEPDLHTLLYEKGDEPARKPVDKIIRFRRVGEGVYEYESAL